MKILVLGDSHSATLGLTDELKALNESFRGVNLRVLTVQGASIKGFGKRESTLSTRQLLTDNFNSFKPDYVCFALGQVDIELGYYYRRVVKNDSISLDQFSKEITLDYLRAAEDFQKQYSLSSDRIIFKGINLSVLTNSREKAIRYTSKIITENIENNEEKARYLTLLRDSFASNLQRYKAHKAFNEKLLSLIDGKYKYFDINDVLEDTNNKGHCKLEYIPAYRDHHILDSLYIRNISVSRLIRTALNV